MPPRIVEEDEDDLDDEIDESDGEGDEDESSDDDSDAAPTPAVKDSFFSFMVKRLQQSPATKKLKAGASVIYKAGATTLKYTGKAAWYVSTTSIVMLLPLIYAMEKETGIQAQIQMERDAMAQQNGMAPAPNMGAMPGMLPLPPLPQQI